MLSIHSKYFGALLSVLLWATVAHAQPAGTRLNPVRDIAKELICPCPDCGKQALDQCPDKCAEGKKHRDEIAGLLGENKTRDEILKYFATTYGAYMLGDPPREGIGKLASWVPYGVVVLGLLPLLLMARARHVRKPSGAQAGKKKSKSGAKTAEDARLDQALREFDY